MRFFAKIRRVIEYLPIIWRTRDFDYQYALDIFRYQLERTANFFESNKTYSADAKQYASRIRTAIKLMDKVYNEEYGTEYQDKLNAIYGQDALEFQKVHKINGEIHCRFKFETWNNAKEIRAKFNQLFLESQKKQEKAHRILWDFIAHNIRNWWD